ncbi:hypothetical protein C8E89_1703 [Mycolicibacterium moriokaense]|uniref:DDE family transposase n=1 Tax=Mycolicibacterium moriokaense TaxID=39691 RepID=A0A318H163_9MYCO|nr:hypothetical protein C8E89_1703 [Mycolicibacterium moriokaense]
MVRERLEHVTRQCVGDGSIQPSSVRLRYHHKRESIEAHLTIVFAALAVGHWIEHQTGWHIKKFVRSGHAATAPSTSAPAGKQLPPPTHYPTTSAKPSPRSIRRSVCNNLAQVGSLRRKSQSCRFSLKLDCYAATLSAQA